VITNAKRDIPNYHKIPTELLQISFSKKAISDRTSKSMLQTRGDDAHKEGAVYVSARFFG